VGPSESLKRIFLFDSKHSVSGQVLPTINARNHPLLFPMSIPPALSAVTNLSSEEWDYQQHSLASASTPPYLGSDDKERASIWSFSTVDEDPEYPRPTRLYQCALVLAGFMATFQTIGANQTYGIFQACPSAEPLFQSLHDLLNKWYFLTRSTIPHLEAK
jgi:hypothetical protein